MVTPTEHAFRPQIEGTSASQASPFRILIVDDDPSLRRTFPHVLARPDRVFDECGTIGEAIARDKDLTRRLLASVGVPVPEGRVARDADDAWEAAEEIGLPVAVKPVDGNHGRGVSLDLRTRQEIHDAWALADKHGSEVLVERFIPGHEHRMLVVGGQLVAAARGDAAWVTADGVSTVRQLIDRQQAFLAAFEAIIARPNEQEEVLREMAVQCLSA